MAERITRVEVEHVAQLARLALDEQFHHRHIAVRRRFVQCRIAFALPLEDVGAAVE